MKAKIILKAGRLEQTKKGGKGRIKYTNRA